jgi:hypothetical protein
MVFQLKIQATAEGKNKLFEARKGGRGGRVDPSDYAGGNTVEAGIIP